MDSNGSAEIPGYYFEAGKNYTLNIYVSADDWMNGSRNIDFTAQENPDRDPAPAIVSMDPETAARRQPVTFTFDQTYAKLLCNVKPNNSTFFGIKEIVENTDQWVCNGSYFTSSEADEWILRVFAENNGVWSLPGELVFNVEAMPHLEAPVIVSAPSEVNLMSEFTVTVEPVENAQRYYLMLERYNETDDCYEWIGSTLSRSTAILFDDWSDDAEPGEYLVTVYAAADDYLDSASTQFTMTVIDAERPAAPVVTMTPGPYSDGNPVTFLLDRNYGEMRIYREMDGEDWGYTNESVYGSQVSLWLEPGEWTLRFQYKENGIWSELSQPVSLTVEEAPAAPEPVVESYPEEVHLFDPFTVVMTPQENVQSYYADLYQIDDTGKWTWRGGGDGETAIQVGYWADNSTPGNYVMRIIPNAEGYNNEGIYYDLYLTVLEERSDDERPAAPVLTLTKQNITTGDSFGFALDRSYGKFRLYREKDGQDYGYETWDEVGNRLWIYRYEAGEWTVYGQYLENGVWSAKSQPLTFTVTQAPLAPISIVESCPTEVHLFDTITIVLTPQPAVQSYEVSLLQLVDDRLYGRGNKYAESSTIEFDGWRDNATPGNYILRIFSFAEGYDNSESYVELPLTVLEERSDDERPAAPVLTLTKQNITSGDSFGYELDRSYGKFRLHREKDGEDYGFTTWREAGNYLGDFSYAAGEWTVYGQYWEDGMWSAKSQPLTFTVTQAPMLPAPIVESCPTEVHLYDTITITLTPQQEVEFYDVSLYQVEGNNWNWRGGIGADGPTIEFNEWRNDPTPGSYVLMIISYAEGYDNRESYVELPLTVLAELPDDQRPAAPVLTLTQQNITTADSFEFTLDRSYGKFRLHRERDGQDYGYETWDEVGNRLWIYRYEAGEWTVYGQYLENGVWSAKSQPLTFTVTQAPLAPIPIVESCPTEVHLFDTITIVLTPQEEVERYSVTLYQAEGNSWYWRGNIRAEGPTIEFGAWSNDPTPGSYFLRIVSDVEGFDNRDRYVDVALTVLPPAESADARVFTLPGSLERIEAEAFEGSIATMFVIPEHCTAIESRAFANCRSLVRVVIPSSVRTIADDAFDGCYDLTIVTPAGSAADAYARARGWTVEND